jgi:hypothetical protein
VRLGIYLATAGTNRVDWNEIAAINDEAFRNVAPKALIARLEIQRSPRPVRPEPVMPGRAVVTDG